MEHGAFWMESRFWVALAFVVFFVLFGKRLWAALAAMLDARAAAIGKELDEAARLRAEAEQMLRDARERREAAVKDAQALIEGAQTEAARLATAAAEEARAAARRREQMALDRIAAAEKTALDEVRIAAAEVATTAARDVIAGGLPAESAARLIDHAISGLPAALSS
jgi:F-type H+-transporting ATPase subunit b